MSLIYGLINPQKEVVIPTLQTMYESMRFLPHEKSHSVIKENAGFGHFLTFNTPESIYEQQPDYVSESNILFVAEGRLDNRDLLSKKLTIQLHNQFTDGELIKAAYLKWGQDCPKHLKGDWSFAVYDYADQELFLARDQHGYRVIYYHYDNKQLAFSSSVKGILSLKNFDKKLNIRALLASLLLWEAENKTMQIYENLCIVPPAHTLSLKDNKITLKRYWFPENISVRNYKNVDTYAEELREIFEAAVSVRLRSHRPVSSMLSGGLDSSSVVAIASQILKKTDKNLSAFSHVPLFKKELLTERQPNRMLDETPNILATASYSGNVSVNLLNSSDLSPIQGFKEALQIVNRPFHAAANAFWLIDLFDKVTKSGFGTLLTGEMGNATISYSGINYLMPWYHIAFLKEPVKLSKRLLKPLLMKYDKAFLYRSSKGLIDYVQSNYANEHILQEWKVIENIKEKSKGFNKYYPDAKAGMLGLLQIGSNARCQFGHSLSMAFGIELRDPTGDIDVIEYCLSIPNHAFFDKDLNNKYILKRMMQGHLPEQVLYSSKIGVQAADVWYRILQDKNQINELLDLVKTCPQVHEIMDLKKLNNDWKNIQYSTKNKEVLSADFIKGLMFSYFIWQVNQ